MQTTTQRSGPASVRDRLHVTTRHRGQVDAYTSSGGGDSVSQTMQPLVKAEEASREASGIFISSPQSIRTLEKGRWEEDLGLESPRGGERWSARV